MLEAPCEVGQAKITYGYNLPALKVIHTLGPNIIHGKKPTATQIGQLKMCYEESLEVAYLNHSSTIALFAISTGQ